MFQSTTTYKKICLSTLIHFSTPHELHPPQLSTNVRHVLNRYIPEMTNTYTAQPTCRNLSSVRACLLRHFGKVVSKTKWKYNKKSEGENEINCSEFGDLTAMLLQVHMSLNVNQSRGIKSSIKWRPCDFHFVRNFSPNDKCHNPEDLNLLKEFNY
jgi:hypothetical protein